MIQTRQCRWKNNQWEMEEGKSQISPQLCLLFGARKKIETDGKKAIQTLKNEGLNAPIVTISTAGNILDSKVSFDDLITTCIEFEKTDVVVNDYCSNCDDEFSLGQNITKDYDTNNLALLLVFTAHGINAGNFIDGINQGFNHKVLVSGGVAGDGTLFEKTLLGIDGNIDENKIVTIGLYSKHLKVSHGSKGGWLPFGPPRKVTKAKNNFLYEIDNQSVLDLYKEYLGSKAKDLPGSGLLFPFAIIDDETKEFVVRGIQDINEKEKAIILYGNIEKGQTVKLMRANHTKLIDGAGESAFDVLTADNEKPQLALLVSCVARAVALNQLIDEEIEEIKEVFGEKTTLCGFYSYSEFSPVKGAMSCSLHNQTMTITALSEK